jgi:hypothetical protein
MDAESEPRAEGAEGVPGEDDGRLAPAERRRGRLLAFTSHPAGMTHRMVLTDHVPTLALVALGASESVVGMQRAFIYLAILIQLPTLRLVGRIPKRRILVAGQIVALLGTAPLLAFADLYGAGGVGVALGCFALAALGFAVCETVWFPLLHGYQEDARIGRFFGLLRSGWHLTLIVYFLGAQRWLEARPGEFAPLFAVAFALGVLRVLLIARLPERSERTGSAIRVRQALALLRREPLLRRYLAGVAVAGSMRVVVFTFAVVMMRRVVGFSEGEVLYTTIAVFTGGLLSLWIWGRVVDAVGPEPVFRWTAVGQAVLFLGFFGVSAHDGPSLALAVALFFSLWALSSGFDVADTHVIFALAPSHAPARTLVVARVCDSLLRGAAPLGVGLVLDRLLGAGLEPLLVYRGLFAACAFGILLALLPLRAFRTSDAA